MQLEHWMKYMEEIAPAELAESWDNSGLLIGPERRELRHVLLALDCTEAVAEEAKWIGADLVLTHHPLFFSPVKRILPDDPGTAAAWKLIRYGIGLFSAHTNLDRAKGGVNDALAETLGIKDAVPYGDGTGRIGMLEEEVALENFVRMCENVLHTVVSYTGNPMKRVRRIAVLGGAGGSMIREAADAGADVYLTGEAKHHEGIASEVLGISLLAAGHDETERVILPVLMDRLQGMSDDIKYSLALSDGGPFRRGTGGKMHEQ